MSASAAASEVTNADSNDLDFAVKGTVIKNEPKPKDPNEEIEEFFENRVLKPLPDFSYNPDLKELAVSV